jgi:hypothetical protein
MTHYVDELAVSGAPLHDDELVAYLLAGLDEDYNVVFTAVVARVDPISPSDLYAQLLSFEQHAHLQAHFSSGTSSSAMDTNRGRGFSGRGSGGSDRGHNPSRGRGRTSHDRGRSSGGSRAQCQVCLKIGHTADRCCHRYEEDYVPETHNVATTSGPGVDQTWYTNSRCTTRILVHIRFMLPMA